MIIITITIIIIICFIIIIIITIIIFINNKVLNTKFKITHYCYNLRTNCRKFEINQNKSVPVI